MTLKRLEQTVDFDINRLRRKKPKPPSDLQDQTSATSNKAFSKISFTQMKVIGQFNHSFVIAHNGRGQLFIFDQHACDEKFNYESLCSLKRVQPMEIPNPKKIDLAHRTLSKDEIDKFLRYGLKISLVDDQYFLRSVPSIAGFSFSTQEAMDFVQHFFHILNSPHHVLPRHGQITHMDILVVLDRSIVICSFT